MAKELETRTILRVMAVDHEDHDIVTHHKRVPEFDAAGYGGSAGSFYGYMLEVTEGPGEHPGESVLHVSHLGNDGSGSEGLGSAREHSLDIGIFGIAVDWVWIDSDVLPQGESALEHGQFEAPHELAVYDRRLIVPLAAGRLTLNLSSLEHFTAPQPVH